MSDSESAKAVLCEYYDALLKEDFDKLSSVCDDSLTVISLYGSTTVSGESNLIEMYKGIMDNFEAQGMSRTIGYDKDEFKTTDIQVNVKPSIDIRNTSIHTSRNVTASDTLSTLNEVSKQVSNFTLNNLFQDFNIGNTH